jgi:nucleoside-diphosphate-sugar epimerase
MERSRGVSLVTGATGFVGRSLLRSLEADGVPVRAALRTPPSPAAEPLAHSVVGDIGDATEWGPALDGVDVVFHLAARVHVMKDRSADPLADFRRVNVLGSERLAHAAVRAGVRRIVFASTVKVLGEETAPDRAFDDASVPAPADPYSVSKLEAEAALRAACAGRVELVVLRPPLMYGADAKGNLPSLMKAVAAGVPLPLGSVRNRRSMLSVDNFVDALRLAATSPAAAGGAFLVCDGEDLSTPELVRRIGRAVNRPARLWPVPPALLERAARLVGAGDRIRRLTGSLRIDATGFRAATGWTPRGSVDDGLAAMAAGLGLT